MKLISGKALCIYPKDILLQKMFLWVMNCSTLRTELETIRRESSGSCPPQCNSEWVRDNIYKSNSEQSAVSETSKTGRWWEERGRLRVVESWAPTNGFILIPSVQSVTRTCQTSRRHWTQWTQWIIIRDSDSLLWSMEEILELNNLAGLFQCIVKDCKVIKLIRVINDH